MVSLNIPRQTYFNTGQDNHKNIKGCAAAVSSFWLLSNIFQRFAGIVGIHSGKRFPIKFSYGVLGFAISSIFSYIIANEMESIKSSLDLSNKYSWAKQIQYRYQKREIIRKFYIGLVLFAVAEQKAFLTLIPSSLLDIGVFANTKLGSVIVNSNIASDLQRQAIQTYGRFYGCHHCGNRQILSIFKPFIADHQPPTKLMNQFNKSYMSKLTRIKVRILVM
jgi:hypothetical protein